MSLAGCLTQTVTTTYTTTTVPTQTTTTTACPITYTYVPSTTQTVTNTTTYVQTETCPPGCVPTYTMVRVYAGVSSGSNTPLLIGIGAILALGIGAGAYYYIKHRRK